MNRQKSHDVGLLTSRHSGAEHSHLPGAWITYLAASAALALAPAAFLGGYPLYATADSNLDFPWNAAFSVALGAGLLAFLGALRWHRYILTRQHSLSEASSRASEMMRASLDGLLLTDNRGSILESNPAAEEMFGMCCKQMLGKNINTLVPDIHRGRDHGYLPTFRGDGDSAGVGYGREIALSRESGERFDAYVLVNELQALPESRFIVVVHEITKRKQAEDELRAANELLEKRISARTSELMDVNAMLKREISERKKAEEKLRELATTDGLTKIYNRREFDRLLNLEFGRARRYDTPLSIIMFDVDHFKQINESSGHQVGDEVLLTLAEFVRANLRSSDIFARWGGEEFAILLPGTQKLQAYMLAEKLRIGIERTEFAGVGGITCSFSVSDSDCAMSPTDMTGRADALLYRSKQSGRDCVSIDDSAGDSNNAA